VLFFGIFWSFFRWPPLENFLSTPLPSSGPKWRSNIPKGSDHPRSSRFYFTSVPDLGRDPTAGSPRNSSVPLFLKRGQVAPLPRLDSILLRTKCSAICQSQGLDRCWIGLDCYSSKFTKTLTAPVSPESAHQFVYGLCKDSVWIRHS